MQAPPPVKRKLSKKEFKRWNKITKLSSKLSKFLVLCIPFTFHYYETPNGDIVGFTRFRGKTYQIIPTCWRTMSSDQYKKAFGLS